MEGGCRGLVLGKLLKITDGTNGERCILFKIVWWTLNEKTQKKLFDEV